ncbi:unnamed protein product [Rotaria sp. Silwood1]|nr:unnamed protein product [Rotaria sp. Silwood1]CAF5138955.1 unnamed protein product [Rotaria sp. Silwood1]
MPSDNNTKSNLVIIVTTMAFFNLNTYDISRSSRRVKVPDNSIAKLMYYLDCMCTLIEYDESDLNRLRDYRNYDDLTDTDIRLLFVFCATLDPDIFIDKVMIEDRDGKMCGSSLNRIYDLGEVQRSFMVVNSIVVAGRTRRVKKIMAYRPQWLNKYYTQPMAQLTAIFQRERQQKAIRELFNTCTIS